MAAWAAAMSEAALQAGILEYAGARHWTHHHNYDSRKSTRGGGFPDLFLGRMDWGRLIVAELKNEAEWPTAIQRYWLDMFAASGAEVYVIKPRWYDAFLPLLDSPVRPVEHPCIWVPGRPDNDSGHCMGQGETPANRKRRIGHGG